MRSIPDICHIFVHRQFFSTKKGVNRDKPDFETWRHHQKDEKAQSDLGRRQKDPHFWLNVYVARFPVFEPRMHQDRPFRWLDLDISSTFKNKKLKIRDNDEIDQLAITVSTLWPSQSSSSGALECTHPSTFQKLKNFWNVVVYWKWCRFWQ